MAILSLLLACEDWTGDAMWEICWACWLSGGGGGNGNETMGQPS
jgi:hypothetical protein